MLYVVIITTRVTKTDVPYYLWDMRVLSTKSINPSTV